MISMECLNYWWSEIEKEWGWKKGANRHAVEQMVNYDESKYPGKEKHDNYINSEKWKRRRKGFLKQYQESYDIIQCEICLTKDNAINWNLHHKSYANFAHKYFYVEMQDIVCLCPACHESLHLSIDIALKGSNRALFREHKNRNGKFFDSDGCFRFGKYKGQNINEVPRSYLSWVERETDSDYDLEILEHSH